MLKAAMNLVGPRSLPERLVEARSAIAGVLEFEGDSVPEDLRAPLEEFLERAHHLDEPLEVERLAQDFLDVFISWTARFEDDD